MNHAIVSEVLYLCYWHSQESSPSVQDSLRTTLSDRNMAYMSECTCILLSMCVVLHCLIEAYLLFHENYV